MHTPHPTICIDTDGHGRWQVMPDSGALVTCDTIDDARKVAYRRAAERRRPCELVVRDAYHRVVAHELLRVDESMRVDTLMPGGEDALL
ncbi:MAG: hypothetical protein WBQ18_16655 [Solirubrobacteraceae bacterium]|jgi:hypothetical protein